MLDGTALDETPCRLRFLCTARRTSPTPHFSRSIGHEHHVAGRLPSSRHADDRQHIRELQHQRFGGALVASIVDTVARTILQLEGGEIRNDSYTTERAMQSLYSVLEEVHLGRARPLPRWKSVLAFDALVLFNVLAPQTFGISEYVVLRAYSIAPGAVAQNDARRLRDVPGISHQDISEALEYWSRLKRRGDSHCSARTRPSIWFAVCDAAGTTFSNSISDMRRVAGTFEKWVRSIWHLHSPRRRIAPRDVVAAALLQTSVSDDVFGCRGGACGPRQSSADESQSAARGALFGIDYSSLNQVLCLLNASRLPDVIVNYARNEGSICLRTSCNALKTDTNGNKPSMKSTSATYDDNDFEASGDREAREESARRQTEAWRKNNELLFEMTKYSHYKEGYSGSMRGSINSKLQREQNETEMQDKTHRLYSFLVFAFPKNARCGQIHPSAQVSKG